ncbi:MAG: ABC transporter ATP-binding protein [Patescibacteria group bacterium]
MFSFKKIFKYLWIFVRPYKVAFSALSFVVVFRTIFYFIIIPYGYKGIIDALSLMGVDKASRLDIALASLLVIVTGYVLAVFCARYRDFIVLRFRSRVIKDIYDFSFSKLAKHSYKFYANNFAGSLVAKVKRLVGATTVIENQITNVFLPIITMVIGSIISIYFNSKILTLYLLIWVSVYSFLVLLFVRQKIKLDMKEAEADSSITGVLADSITNILNVKMFSSFNREYSYLGRWSTLLKDSTYNASRFGFIRGAFQAAFIVSFEIFILYTMINLWMQDKITLGIFVLVYAYLSSIFDRIWDLSEGITKFMKSMADVKEVVDIFETEIDIKDVTNPESLRVKEGTVEFSDVSFGYIEDKVVFKDFNLKINKGERVGVVGHSGGGKTTLTKMLLRFMDVNSGQILIDGQDISKISQDDLRSVISYVPQESILFHRTIKENISYSKPDATEEEIISVAKKAHAHEFISGLSNGYDTLVGERGVKLSGGERQRVAIARAMLKNAPILVLDEATSSLDSISESYIQEALSELMKGKTTLVIAHRLSTIQKMDRIIVLDNGRIIEEGTHEELRKRGKTYASLWQHQTCGFLE